MQHPFVPVNVVLAEKGSEQLSSEETVRKLVLGEVNEGRGITALSYTPFTRSSKHRANVEQIYSKCTC